MLIKDFKIDDFVYFENGIYKKFVIAISAEVVIKREDKYYTVSIMKRYEYKNKEELLDDTITDIQDFIKNCEDIDKKFIINDCVDLHGRVIGGKEIKF